MNLIEIQKAHERIRHFIRRTPVMTCGTIDAIAGASLYFKCENFQKVGAFKFRGACNAVFSLSQEEAARGVVTHSSGNHAAALSLAASRRSIPAHIVMPSNAPPVKIAAVQGYGGRITFCEPTLASREATAQQIIDRTGAVMIHPYNDLRIIAGQGTAVLELLEEVLDLDAVLAPVGGGGLLSGTAIAAKSVKPEIQVIGCEPANADDAFRSKEAGTILPSVNPNTIADGLRTSLGDKTFPIVRDWVDEIWLATEQGIRDAMKLVFERMKIVIEPSSAVPLAALIEKGPAGAGKIGIVLSGGNVDLSRFFDSV